MAGNRVINGHARHNVGIWCGYLSDQVLYKLSMKGFVGSLSFLNVSFLLDWKETFPEEFFT